MRASTLFNRRQQVLIAALAAVTALGSYASRADAGTLYWDGGGTPTSGTDGPGAWDVGSTWYDPVGNGTTGYVADSDAIFGTGTAAAGPVTFTSGVNVNTLTLNAPGSGIYTIGSPAGGILGFSSTTAPPPTNSIIVNASTIINARLSNDAGTVSPSPLNLKGVLFNTAGQTLTLGGGAAGSFLNKTAAITAAASNGQGGVLANVTFASVVGSDATVSAASTLALTPASPPTPVTFAINGAGAVIGIGDVLGTTGGLRVDAGATLNTNNSNLNVGGYSARGVVVIDGGTVNVGTGRIAIGRAGGAGRLTINSGTLTQTAPTQNNASLYLGGEGNATSRFNMNGGTITLPTAAVAATNTGYLFLNLSSSGASNAVANIAGGTLTLGATSGISMNQGSAAASSTLNVSGGTTYVGSTGITNGGTATYAINLSGGTLGALANWSTSLNKTITSGAFTYQAANAGGTAFDITDSGTVTGSGALVKTGAGRLTVSSASNDFAGGTTVQGGTLQVTSTGLLGTGNVVVAPASSSVPATLQLDGNTNLSALQTLTLTDNGSALATALLNYVGTDVIAGLTYNASSFAPGVYSAANTTFLTGTGSLTIVPEPLGLSVVGIAGAAALLRRRRRI